MSSFNKTIQNYCKDRNTSILSVCKKAKLSYTYIVGTQHRGISLKQFDRLCKTLQLETHERAYLHTLARLRRPRDRVIVNNDFIEAVTFTLMRRNLHWDDPAAVCNAVLRCAGVRTVSKVSY
jgi:dTDP-D-glucose 4,6-dehydratase